MLRRPGYCAITFHKLVRSAYLIGDACIHLAVLLLRKRTECFRLEHPGLRWSPVDDLLGDDVTIPQICRCAPWTDLTDATAECIVFVPPYFAVRSMKTGEPPFGIPFVSGAILAFTFFDRPSVLIEEVARLSGLNELSTGRVVSKLHACLRRALFRLDTSSSVVIELFRI